MDTPEHILTSAGIRPTSNRISVLRELQRSGSPLSLSDLEHCLDTIEKSSIFRVLTLLLEHHIIHAVEDGRGITNYEICHGKDVCTIGDMHVHFYCESCRKIYCFADRPAPMVDVPEGFIANSINYMLKGICPRCRIMTE